MRTGETKARSKETIQIYYTGDRDAKCKRLRYIWTTELEAEYTCSGSTSKEARDNGGEVKMSEILVQLMKDMSS